MTDFAFSPHDDGVIASGSQDGTVKVSPPSSSSSWAIFIIVIIIIMLQVFRVPSDLFSGNPMEKNMDTPLVSLPEQARRIETVIMILSL